MKDDLYMEWLCFKQHVFFSLRNKRYLLIAITQYFYSLINWRQARSLRYTFCTLQLIDDYLDGDRPCPDRVEPLRYLENLKQSIGKNSFDSSELQQMTKFFLLRTEKIPTMRIEARKAFYELIEIMMADRKRVLEKNIYSSREMQFHHHTTFRYSLDIVLMAMESPLRSETMPEILDIFGWCSTVRDLEEDLDKSLVNIPSEVTAKVPNFLSLKTSEKINSPVIKNWLIEETYKAEKLFTVCDHKYEVIKNIHGSFIFKMFLNSMKKYLQVYHA